MTYIMGIDIGTTGCKAVVFDENANPVTRAYREYPMDRSTGTIDPVMVRDQAFSVIRECTEKYPEIEAICTASFGESVVALDGNGDVCMLSVLYTDYGAESQKQKLADALGGTRIAEITGHMPHAMYTVNRLMDLREKHRELYNGVSRFLSFSAYIAHCLGAEPYCEHSQGGRTMMFDVRKMIWSEEIMDAAGIDAEKLPEPMKAGTCAGRVSETAARELGFKNRPALIVGGQDQPCVALGMAAVHGGDVAYGMGTVECFTLCLDEFKMNADMYKANLVCAPHVVEGKYLTYGVLFSGGAVITDIRNKLYAKEMLSGENVYPKMMREMTETETNILFLPHLAGTGTPEMDPLDTGVISGLTLRTKRGELVRAALEGISFDIRRNIENMERSGIRIDQIRCAGGGSASADGMRVRSTAIGRPLQAAIRKEAGALGTFYIAARSLGIIDSFEQIPIPECVSYEPGKDISEKYTRWNKLLKAVRGI